MFGPNSSNEFSIAVPSSHRGAEFETLYSNIVEKLTSIFNLHSYDILFIAGSATTGVESVVSSLIARPAVVGNADGKWIQRWKDMVGVHWDNRNSESRTSNESLEISCLLETSTSALDSNSGGIVDAVSAFPYFDLPTDCVTFVTCPNKQLGALAGFAIVGVRKDCWHLYSDKIEMSTLNLARYYEYGKRNQTPTTPPVGSMLSLSSMLSQFDLAKLRSVIDSRCDRILEIIGDENLMGVNPSPVLTIKSEAIPEHLVHKYDLYRGAADPDYISLFMYSENRDLYHKFFTDLERARREIGFRKKLSKN